MALQFFTGFDYYDELQVQRVWDYYQNGASTPGRFGGFAYSWNNQGGFLSTSVPAASTVILGMAFFLSYGDATNPIIVFQDATTSLTSPITQVDIRVTSDAGFQVTRNGTVIATSLPNLFTFNFWNYLEVKVFVHDSTGFVQIRLNGQTYLNATTLDTKYTGNNYINMVRVQPFASTGAFNFKIDDMYLCDDTGSSNNNFLGECRVQTQFPSADGERNDFLGVGDTANWKCVDETPADDDLTYVRSAVVGNIDNYVMGTLALSGTIFGMQLNVTHRKDDVGSRTVTPSIKVGTTYYEGALFPCNSDYSTAQKIWEKNPDTGVAWTNVSLNNIFAGVKIKG